MSRPRKLSRTFVERVTDPGRYGDGFGGFGLSLLVKPRVHGGVAKSWSQRLRIDGVNVNMGLGSFPIVTLERARAKALANLQLLERGGNPTSKRAEHIPTFGECLERAFAVKSGKWRSERTEQYTRSVMNTHALPRIGRRPINRVTPRDLLDFLTPLAHDKPQVAKRVKIGLSMAFTQAIAEGLRPDNPAKDIATALPSMATKEHHRAMPFSEVPTAIKTVRESGAKPETKLAFEFLVLSATRSGEVRGATWDEIDLDAATWTIPASRMKAERMHRVPLSKAALDVLESAKALNGHGKLIFPSSRGTEMSDARISKLLRENGVPATPHGFRSSFRDWCAHNNIDRQVAEAALAHATGNAVETAYLRSDMLDLRRDVMERWAGYIYAP